MGVATCLNDMALLLQAQGKLVEAKPLYEESLKICRGSLGPQHADVAGSLNILAALLTQQGGNSTFEAEELLREALEIFESSFGPMHPNVAGGMWNLADTVLAQGRRKEAQDIWTEAVKIYENTLGKNHPTTVRCTEWFPLTEDATNDPTVERLKESMIIA